MPLKRLFPMAGLALLASPSCSPRPQQEDTSAAVQAVTAASAREVAAFSGGNADSVLPLFAPDAVVLPPNEAAVRGRDSLRLWAQGMYQQFSLHAHYPSSDVTVVGDWAIQRYSYALTMTPKAGGGPVEDHGKGIHIFRRQADGSWLIVQDIWNSDIPAAAPQR